MPTRPALSLDQQRDPTGTGKVSDRSRGRLSAHELGGAASQTSRNRRLPGRIAVKIGKRTVLLRVEDIDWVEASNRHVRLHVGSHVHVVRGTMTDMERRLRSFHFVRIHKSVIVNLDRVEELEGLTHGEYSVILGNGKRLRSGRAFRDRLKALIG